MEDDKPAQPQQEPTPEEKKVLNEKKREMLDSLIAEKKKKQYLPPHAVPIASWSSTWKTSSDPTSTGISGPPCETTSSSNGATWRASDR
jgi:hypothetical protein